MAKTKTKIKPAPAAYPISPHIVGMDWVELPVRRPAHSAAIYRAIGFSPRGSTSAARGLAIGGTVILLRRAKSTHNESATSPSGVLIQVATDNVNLKRQQLIDLDLRPGPFRRLGRGDRAFEWRDEDGHTVRFVGPARQPTDKDFKE